LEEVLYVKIDKSRKTTATSLITALGINAAQALKLFDSSNLISNTYQQDGLTGDGETD